RLSMRARRAASADIAGSFLGLGAGGVNGGALRWVPVGYDQIACRIHDPILAAETINCHAATRTKKPIQPLRIQHLPLCCWRGLRPLVQRNGALIGCGTVCPAERLRAEKAEGLL